jgi:Trp operon repressor
LDRKFERRRTKKFEELSPGFFKGHEMGNKKKKLLLCHLDQSEKVSIIHQILIEKFSVKDVAAQYGVKISTITYLLKKANSNPDILEEICN